jgi:formate dehydrogenase subunit gamma
MAEQANRTAKGRDPRRSRLTLLLTVAILLLGTLALPLTGYLVTGVNSVEAAAAQQATDTNPRADYWREVRDGQAGVTQIKGLETGVLIQNGGQNWRQIRQGPLTTYGAIGLAVVILLMVIFHFAVGSNKLEERTGRTVTRWTMLDRVLHWYTAILFIILAITGLSLLYGREVLIPLMGKEGFAAFAAFAKPIHNYLSLFFSAGIAIMLLKWIGQNIPNAADIKWITTGGGYFGGEHHEAGFVNGGEKVWYWILFFGSTAMIGSGIFLLFPNLDWSREAMQNANVIHGISSLLVIAGSLGHIYLGTIGNQGTLEGMVTGEVDEAWARKHHGLWLDEVKGSQSGAGGAARPSPAAPHK